MISPSHPKTRIAIACGGTGGHLFPGLAVADQLARRGCAVTLLVSPKEVDQQSARTAEGMQVVTLPGIGLERGRRLAFLRGFVQSCRGARALFRAQRPQAVLAMGGFTSAPPILAARRCSAWTSLHESNTIPGRANRWLSWVVDQAFVGFQEAATRLHQRKVIVTGTPVRAQFQARDPGACRIAVGLHPSRPVVLVMGGSQGASGINDLTIQSLPFLARLAPDWQWLHLTGSRDLAKVQAAYEAFRLRAVVKPFCSEMDLALGAATAAVSRAGASSLAELAALRLPAVLVPYPAAADNHQFYNAQAFAASGAAQVLEQKAAAPELLVRLLCDLVQDGVVRARMQKALRQWHAPRAAEQIAQHMLGAIGLPGLAPEPAEAAPELGQAVTA